MTPTHAVDHKIEIGRTKFASMTSTYCLGVFNDNFFKQAAMLLAVTLGLNHLQGIATLLFALPFILFSSIAGWAADRFSKKNVVIASKGVELSAMLIGSAGLITGNWPCILALSSCIIGLALLLGASVESLPHAMQFYWLALCLIAAGLAGGSLIIPVASFLQTHPVSGDKGRVLAASNFCTFCAILCSGIIFYVMDSYLAPSQIMGCIGAMAILTAVLLYMIRTLTEKNVKTIIAGLLRAILSLRYDVEVKGFDQINKTSCRGTVFLPNHPALIDPLILMSILYEKFQPRSLSDEEQTNKPFVRQAMKLINPILIPDVAKQGKSSRKRVFRALREVVKSLNDNEEILMYPSGRLYRCCRENLGGNSGVEYILKHAPQTRIILVRTTGLWGSSFSHAQNTSPSVHSSIGSIIAYFCANLIFFGPRRKVTVEFTENHTLKLLKDRREINPYLELFYNQTVQRNIHIPYYWWKGGGHRKLAKLQASRAHGNLKTITAATHKLVTQKIDETG